MTLTFTIPSSLWLTANRAPHNRGHRARQVRDLQDIAATEPDLPCERCVFIPTPGGRCICEVSND